MHPGIPRRSNRRHPLCRSVGLGDHTPWISTSPKICTYEPSISRPFERVFFRIHHSVSPSPPPAVCSRRTHHQLPVLRPAETANGWRLAGFDLAALGKVDPMIQSGRTHASTPPLDTTFHQTRTTRRAPYLPSRRGSSLGRICHDVLYFERKPQRGRRAVRPVS
jgi:hypothetical protein